MRWRRPDPSRNGFCPGIILLILSLVHAPLPEPDFHNIRHHDRPGEVCEHHDHLLRWHPGAGSARDVSVLHWHWYLPGSNASDEGAGLAVHAHTPAWPAVALEIGPQIAPDTGSRLAVRPSPSTLEFPDVLPVPAGPGGVSAGGAHPTLAFSATFAPRVSLTSLLHRWVC